MRGALCAFAAFVVLMAASWSRGLADQPPTQVQGDPMSGAAVASDDAEAARAAWTALKDGGSAADAVIAAALMLTVTRPEAASIAGAGAALLYDAQGRHITAYVGREVSAARVDPAQRQAQGSAERGADRFTLGRRLAGRVWAGRQGSRSAGR